MQSHGRATQARASLRGRSLSFNFARNNQKPYLKLYPVALVPFIHAPIPQR